jgi:hypothetical protein
MWAWNELQKVYLDIFSHVVSPHYPPIAHAAWDTIVSDQAQRDMLEASLVVAWRKREKITKQALSNLRWALKETRHLAGYRNIAAHMPIKSGYQNEPDVVPDRHYARATAAHLVSALGDKFLFDTLIAELYVLSNFVHAHINGMIGGFWPGAFPRRPRLRLHRICQEALRSQGPAKAAKQKCPRQSSRGKSPPKAKTT